MSFSYAIALLFGRFVLFGLLSSSLLSATVGYSKLTLCFSCFSSRMSHWRMVFRNEDLVAGVLVAPGTHSNLSRESLLKRIISYNTNLV